MCGEAMRDARPAATHAARATVEKLRAMLARGATLKQAGDQIRELAGSQWRAYRLAVKHQLPRRRRGISRDKGRAIDERLRAARLTLREIARRAQVSLDTVQRRKAKRDGPGPRPCRTRRCPRGHLVYLWPCQTCRALDAGV